MANITINGETVATSADAADTLLFWNVVSGVQRKITKANLIGAVLTGGGTIITNGNQLSVGGNSSITGSVVGNITGSGTLATGGFTGTLPATGTFALLAVANVFTVNQTINSVSTTGNALKVMRNLSSGSTDSPVASIIQDNASDDQAALYVQQDGTGNIIHAFDGSTSVWALTDGGDVFHIGEHSISDGVNFLNAAYVGLQISAAASRQVAIGQASGRAVQLGWVYNATAANAYAVVETESGANPLLLQSSGGNVAIGPQIAPTARLYVDQNSTTGAIPVLTLDQADLSEEFIRFVSTVGAGNPINTTALGAYYGRARVYVQGVGEKWLALYNT